MIPLPRPHLPPFAQALAVAPPPERQVERGTVLQRLRHHPGRTLTESALRTEQEYRDARFAQLGRMLSPGVVAGLALGVQDAAAVPGVLVLQPGSGLAASGQDVVLRRVVQVPLDALRVWGAEQDAAVRPSGIGAIVLQPVARDDEVFASEADREAAFRDPCPLDRDALAFRSFERRDAARLVFVPLPETLAVPAGPRRRNEAAAAVFAHEQAQGPAGLPWTAVGVPLALVELAADGRVLWLDRAAVVRRGGIRPRPSLPVAGPRPSPGPFLRQARLEQQLAQTAELARDPGWGGVGAERLRWLPPCGVLPRRAWEQGRFFPPGWRQAMAPIPLEQLDAALEQAAALAPYDLDAADAVLWLMPVPAAVYEPELLVTPQPDPAFAAALARIGTGVRGRLDRRAALRGMAAVVQGGIDPAAVTAFPADPEAVPGEAGFPPPVPADAVTGWQARTLAALRTLFALAPANLLSDEDLAAVDPARHAGLRPFADRLERRLQAADDAADLGFTRLQTDIYRLRQLMLDEVEATRLATSPVLAGIAKGTNAFAASAGLRAHFAAAKQQEAAPPAPTGSRFAGARMAVEASIGTRGFLLNTSALRIAEVQPAARDPGPATALFSLQPVIRQAAVAERAETNVFANILSTVRAGAVDDLLLNSAASKRQGITLAAAIPGAISDFRTLTIADRLKTSAATEAKASAVRSKAEVAARLQELGVPLTGLAVPLASRTTGLNLISTKTLDEVRGTLNQDQARLLEARITQRKDTEAEGFPALALVEVRPPANGDTTLAAALALLARPDAILDHPALPRLLLAGLLDPDPADGDESAFLEAGVGALEVAVGMLRALEGRIATLRGFLAAVRDTLAELAAIAAGWQEALAAADRDLAEARHDWRVADALRAEEEARVEALRLKRLGILRDHLRFVAYLRPRFGTLEHAAGFQSRPLANVEADPVMEALAEDADPPEELEEMLDVLRAAPVEWVPAAAALVAGLDRPARLDAVYAGFGLRAQARLLVARKAPPPPAATGSRDAAGRVLLAYRQVAQQFDVARLAIDPARAAALSWRERQRRARQELSLNDLIESGAKSRVGHRAQEIVAGFERVATALFQQVQRVEGGVRLAWVQRVSQFDAAADLRDLSRLPGWPALPPGQRRQINRLAGWLFAQVDTAQPQAVALMSDILRVAILLASHAPVAEIVAGEVRAPQTAQVGGAVDVELDRGRPRIGMKVGIYAGGLLAVQGVVRDLAGSTARIEVTATRQAVTRIDAGARVHLHAATARALVRG